MRGGHTLHVFPRLALVVWFPAFGTGCMVSRFGTGCMVSRFGTGCIVSRAWHRRGARFPVLGTNFMISHAQVPVSEQVEI